MILGYKVSDTQKILQYTLRESKRAKNIGIKVLAGGAVVVVVPTGISQAMAEKFILHNIGWVLGQQQKMSVFKILLPSNTRRHYLAHRESARVLVHKKLQQWNAHYNFAYKRVSIRNHTSRWGSCSVAGNLNFNYRLLFLPENLVDYIVVHELCHLKFPHHQPIFWQAVAQTIPDHKVRRKQLRLIV